MPDYSWWEWALTSLLYVAAGIVLWWHRDALRPIPGLLVEWLEGVAYRLEREPDPEECTCRGAQAPVAIHAWELGDTLETGATGPVIDHRCPTCWLPRRPLPVPPRGPGGGSNKPSGVRSETRNGVTYTRGPQPVVETVSQARAEFEALSGLPDHLLSDRQVARMEFLADFVDAATRPQPPATGGVRFGGERQALYWGDRNAGPQVHARLADGTTRTFPSEEEAKAWILSTRLPDPGKSQRH